MAPEAWYKTDVIFCADSFAGSICLARSSIHWAAQADGW
jgi:hypothetical protein